MRFATTNFNSMLLFFSDISVEEEAYAKVSTCNFHVYHNDSVQFCLEQIVKDSTRISL